MGYHYGKITCCLLIEMVPAVSNRGVCLETPTASTTTEDCPNCAILMGTGRNARVVVGAVMVTVLCAEGRGTS